MHSEQGIPAWFRSRINDSGLRTFLQARRSSSYENALRNFMMPLASLDTVFVGPFYIFVRAMETAGESVRSFSQFNENWI
jgi:hypothetical protein